jgi:hypothetical protein
LAAPHHQTESNDRGTEGGQAQAPCEGPERLGARKVTAPPGIPEIGDDREHGAGMQHDQQKSHGRRGGIQAHELFGDDDMRRARDRQQFAEALHYRQNEYFNDYRHCGSK